MSSESTYQQKYLDDTEGKSRTLRRNPAIKKIALPVENGTLSALFEKSTQFKIFTIENSKVTGEKLLNTPHQHSVFFPIWLYMMGVTDILANRICLKTVTKFNHLKINVFVGVEIKDQYSLLNEFLEGMIETNAELCDP